MSSTEIRIPRIIGFPPKISGFPVMRVSSSWFSISHPPAWTAVVEVSAVQPCCFLDCIMKKMNLGSYRASMAARECSACSKHAICAFLVAATDELPWLLLHMPRVVPKTDHRMEQVGRLAQCTQAAGIQEKVAPIAGLEP